MVGRRTAGHGGLLNFSDLAQKAFQRNFCVRSGRSL